MRRFLGAVLRDDRQRVRAVLAVAALHVADDSFLQPAPGTSPLDHLMSGLVPIGILLVAGVVYPHLRAGLRAASAAMLGLIAVVVGVPGAFYLIRGEASGDDYTGLLSLTAGVLLILTVPLMLWSSRRTDGGTRARIARRSLYTLATALATPLVFLWIVFPVGLGYIYFHAGRTALEPRLSVPTQRVEVTTSDSLKLAAWYVPSRNRAAIVLFPGPDRTKEAQMLLRHGYGVLLLEGRGQNGSEGDVNRWAGDRDLLAGAAYLGHRADVDRSRIGAIGFSIGGEILLEAAAQSSAFRAVVSEGAGERVGETDVTGPKRLLVGPSQAVLTAAASVFADQGPPPPIVDRIGLISPRSVLLIYAEHGQGGEGARQPRYFAAAGEPKEIWRVPGSGHTGGIDAQPAEYERRVIGFLDEALLRR